jgi:hypothetical protein
MASANLVSKKSSYKLMNRNDKLEGVGTRMHHPSPPYLHQVGKTDWVFSTKQHYYKLT